MMTGSHSQESTGARRERFLALLRGIASLAWRLTRQLSGDDAYERYLAHVARFHPGEVPMTRAEHFAFRQNEKWNRLSRCC